MFHWRLVRQCLGVPHWRSTLAGEPPVAPDQIRTLSVDGVWHCSVSSGGFPRKSPSPPLTDHWQDQLAGSHPANIAPAAHIDDQAIHGTWIQQMGCSVSSLTRYLQDPLHGTWSSM